MASPICPPTGWATGATDHAGGHGRSALAHPAGEAEPRLSGGHVHALYHHGAGPLHRLAPEVKLAASLCFVAAVVATPRAAFWAFAVHAAVMIGLMAVARLPAGFVLRRMAIEIPFLLFALALPFIGRGERVDVLGLSLSRPGS